MFSVDEKMRNSESHKKKILNSFYPDNNYIYFATLRFQKITPFHKDKYHPKNRGWIHQDVNRVIGGIIYLNKNPEPDTGTSIYQHNDLTRSYVTDNHQCKTDHYLGRGVPDEHYNQYFDSHLPSSKWTETIRVENVYNRMLLFSGAAYHGVPTYGSPGYERLTLPFFINYVASEDVQPPLYRGL